VIRKVYKLDPELGPDVPMEARETRGQIVYHCSPAHFTEEAVINLTLVEQKLLEGGHWFQLWGGEIVSMESPDIPPADPGQESDAA